MKPSTIVSNQKLQNIEKLKYFLNSKVHLSFDKWIEQLVENILPHITCTQSIFYTPDQQKTSAKYINNFPKIYQKQQRLVSFNHFTRPLLRKVKDHKNGFQITDNQVIKSLGFVESGKVLFLYPVIFKEKMIGIFSFLFEQNPPQNISSILEEITTLVAPYLHIILLEQQLKQQAKEIIKSTWSEIKEKKYQKLQKAFHQTQEIAEIGSWSMDIKTGKVEWSRQLYKIFGYNPETYNPSLDNLSKNTHPDDRERIQKMLKIAIKKPQRFEYYQRIISQYGETKVMYGKGYTLVDKANKAVKIIGTAQDVTKAKSLESKIKRQEQILKEELTLQIEKRTQEVEEKTAELKIEKQKVETAHKDILSSMTYARRIQVALLPPKALLRQYVEQSFTFYRPKDIVSGDFYWMGVEKGKIFLAVVDCTGHGVPGALMSMIGNNLLNNIVHGSHMEHPHLILNEFNHRLRGTLHQDSNRNRDGMDVGLCVIDTNNKTLSFAGAKRPLIYIQDDKLHQIKGENISIGGLQKKQVVFHKHVISFEKKTMFYMFSDGFIDQFGSSDDKKYGSKKFRDLLLQIAKESCDSQEYLFDKEISEWMGMDYKQIDDIMVLGFRL